MPHNIAGNALRVEPEVETKPTSLGLIDRPPITEMRAWL
jgi:hypothetical protein